MAPWLVVPLIVGFLILVNALYVAAEFGAVTARRSRIQELANDGNRLASAVLPVVQSGAALDRYVATCQIGITLSSLVLGAYGQARLATALAPLVADWGRLQTVVAESTAATIVLVALTALQVVFGELVPKSLALQHPTAIALYTVLPMRWSTWLFRWFIAILNGSGVFLLKAVGMDSGRHRHVHSPEELELLIAESRDGGLLEPDEQRRLHQALRLGLRTARHLMVPRMSIVAIDLAWSGDRVLETALNTPFSRLPVYEGSIDRTVGILHTKDLMLAHLQDRGAATLKEIIRPAAVVPETIPADQVLRLLSDQRAHQALVIDEFGGVAGLVTLQDVLSELLGDVGDEFNPTPGQPDRLPDGRIRLPAHTPVTDAERWVGAALEGDAGTIGGYVMQVLGRLPVQGDQIVVDGVRIEVEQLQGRVPGTLLITPRNVTMEQPRG